MDLMDAAGDFVGKPTEAALEKIIEMIKANPAAAIGVITVMGMAYIAKAAIDASKST